MEAPPASVAGCRHARNPHHRCSDLCRATAAERARQQHAPMTPASTPAAAAAAHAARGELDGNCGEHASGHAAHAERTAHDAECPGGDGEQVAHATQFASLAGASVPGAQPEEEATGGDVTERAEAARAQGNKHFAAGLYREATEAYSAAIKLLDSCGSEDASLVRGDLLAACLSNRAAAWLRRKRWSEALADCNAVLRAGRANNVLIKALFRRGKAHEGLGDADAALADFKRVVELEPNNAAALEEVDNYGSILHRLVVLSYSDADTRRRQQGCI